ncbi:hypothetical protein BGZ81_007250 [Podila clonocystis]|nr:hypothetical protein BGZ81_007250 [Podila clonocystis]
MVTKLKVLDNDATRADLQELLKDFEPQEAVFEDDMVKVFDRRFLNNIASVRFQAKDKTARALAKRTSPSLVAARSV